MFMLKNRGEGELGGGWRNERDVFGAATVTLGATNVTPYQRFHITVLVPTPCYSNTFMYKHKKRWAARARARAASVTGDLIGAQDQRSSGARVLPRMGHTSGASSGLPCPRHTIGMVIAGRTVCTSHPMRMGRCSCAWRAATGRRCMGAT